MLELWRKSLLPRAGPEALGIPSSLHPFIRSSVHPFYNFSLLVTARVAISHGHPEIRMSSQRLSDVRRRSGLPDSRDVGMSQGVEIPILAVFGPAGDARLLKVAPQYLVSLSLGKTAKDRIVGSGQVNSEHGNHGLRKFEDILPTVFTVCRCDGYCRGIRNNVKRPRRQGCLSFLRSPVAYARR